MRISVVVPVYNAEHSIAFCLGSLRRQQELPYEIIIVDNNSTDGSLGIIEKERRSFGNTNFIICSENKKGPAAARNKGVSVSSGDIIAFTDSDCMPRSDWVMNIKTIFDKDPELGMIGGVDSPYSGPISLSGKFLLGLWTFFPSSLYWSTIKSDYDFFKGKSIVGFNFAVRKEAFKEIDGFDEDFIVCEDPDLCIRALKKGIKIIAIAPALVVCHSQNISIRQLASKQFQYGIWYTYLISKHYRNKVILQFPIIGWRKFDRLSESVIIDRGIINLISLLTIFIVTFIFSTLAGIVLIVSGLIYIGLYTGIMIRKKRADLTLVENVLMIFLWFIKETSLHAGRIYGSWRYKVICF